MAGYNGHANLPVDADLSLKAQALVGASAAGSLIVDTGGGVFRGELILNVTALEIASANEFYTIVLQGSPDAAFGTAGNIVELINFSLGAKAGRLSDADKDDAVGVYNIPVTNVHAGATYRYLRIYTVVAGTVATGINYSARLSYADQY